MNRTMKLTEIFYYNNLCARLTGDSANKDFSYVFLPEKSEDFGYTWKYCNVEKMTKNYKAIDAPRVLTEKEEHELLLTAF